MVFRDFNLAIPLRPGQRDWQAVKDLNLTPFCNLKYHIHKYSVHLDVDGGFAFPELEK